MTVERVHSGDHILQTARMTSVERSLDAVILSRHRHPTVRASQGPEIIAQLRQQSCSPSTGSSWRLPPSGGRSDTPARTAREGPCLVQGRSREAPVGVIHNRLLMNPHFGPDQRRQLATTRTASDTRMIALLDTTMGANTWALQMAKYSVDTAQTLVRTANLHDALALTQSGPLIVEIRQRRCVRARGEKTGCAAPARQLGGTTIGTHFTIHCESCKPLHHVVRSTASARAGTA
jgi:hypothetical protein